MTTRIWAPGEFINPGDLRQPRTAPPTVTSALTNGSFEAGDTGWAKGTGWNIAINAGSFDGTYEASYPSPTTGGHLITNNNEVPVTPGQVINATVMVNTTGNSVSQGGAAIRVIWYNSSHAEISNNEGNIVRGGGSNWYASGVTATAPPGAAFAKLAINAYRNSGPHNISIDAAKWDYIQTAEQAGLVYKAVQADAGFTAATEPVWPTTLGDTVVDNEVTWEAVLASNVTWEASPILTSGGTEPTWPLEVGASVLDGTIIWKAINRRITDVKCPNTKAVAIAASKIFAGDKDIIRFSATVNPLDWSTVDDAGYLPFGLQTYGSNPVAALGLYRSNLVAFNSQGFQMWQVDQNPANMAFLDAVPIGSVYTHSIQPVANDLLMLTAVGARNISIAGASTNLQAEGVGEPIDSLVKAEIKLLTGDDQVISLFWPSAGQYWIIFDEEAFVLTINGIKKKSWSRYVFPSAITDCTLDGNTLVLRSGVKVWEVDADTTLDDAGTGNVGFQGVIQWPYLDMGAMGREKGLVGVDLVATAPQGVTISIGYNQNDITKRTADYAADPDTLTGQMYPFPVSAPSFDLKLTFAANQTWKWEAANLYVNDWRIGT